MKIRNKSLKQHVRSGKITSSFEKRTLKILKNKYIAEIKKLEDDKNLEIYRVKSLNQEEKKRYDLVLSETKNRYESQIAELQEYNMYYSKLIERLREEQKAAFGEDLEDKFDYKKLYYYLIENIKEHFDSPLYFQRITKPCILKSGHTIDEFEFDELFMRNSNDPYDRTKRVNEKIPNLALRNIMEVVDFTENIKERMEKAIYIDAFTQTDDFHNEKDIEKIFKLQNDIVRSREQAFSHFNENKVLSKKNSELNEMCRSVNLTNEKLNKKIAIKTHHSSTLQTELRNVKKKYENAVKEFEASRTQSILNLIKHMYDNSDSWTTSLLCIELTHNIVNRIFGPSVKTVDVGVGNVIKTANARIGPGEQKGLFKWLFSK